MKTALIIVDMQEDFVEGGALACPGGRALVPIINKLVGEIKPDLVITTQDWHPEKTPHFDKWPVHCVAYSKGASFVDGLYVPPTFVQMKKGQDDKDGYSGFNANLYEYNLHDILQHNEIKSVMICGIATDYCVKATALDAVHHGYNTVIIENACVGVTPEGHKAALVDVANAGATVMTLTPEV